CVVLLTEHLVQHSLVSVARPPRRTPLPYTTLFRSSIIVWYVPPAGFVPELVVLRESTRARQMGLWSPCVVRAPLAPSVTHDAVRSEEHTSELQSRENLVCRLLLEKKKH